MPLSVAGFSAPAFGQLEKLFGDSNIVPVRSGRRRRRARAEGGPTKFEMGGAIAVELIRGDMCAAAIGTVSYVDGEKVLAFGHPMFQTGETYAPVSTANVHTVIPSSQSAFVMASPMNEIGSLTQDRQAAIAADTGLRTPAIPMDITITTASGKHIDKGTFHVELLDNKFLTPAIAGAALMNAINYYLPDRDDVTAKVESTSSASRAREPIAVRRLSVRERRRRQRDGRGARPARARAAADEPVRAGDDRARRHQGRSAVRGELRRHQGDPRARPAISMPGTRNTVQVLMSTWDGKDILEDVPVDVPASLAGSIVNIEVTAGDRRSSMRRRRSICRRSRTRSASCCPARSGR